MINTEKYYYRDIPSLSRSSIQQNINKDLCEIIIFNGNCFDAAKLYNNSIIHNFANNTKPGGPTSKFNSNGILQW